MPFEQQPPILPDVHMSDESLKLAGDTIEKGYALALINKTFNAFETYRSQNHDRRWNTHDSLYVGFVPARVWDGSNIPRAAFTQPIVFDQVESALPAICNSIFGVSPDWFQVQAEPGTDAKEARQVQDAMSYNFEHPMDEIGSNCVQELKMAIKSSLLYGNGGVCIEYDPILKRPTCRWVDIRDVYIDPGLTTPNVDEGRALIHRKLLTIEEIKELGKDTRFDIPSDDILWGMAKNWPQEFAENTKRVQESLRGVYFSPGTSDYVPLPADHKVEVLIYYSKSRVIWCFNRQWIAYNQPNPYGFIPYAFSPCYIYISRFYAQSIADVQEYNQRYTEALYNAHLDELTLNIHPPRVTKRNNLITPNQQKWRPGAVFSADDAKDMALLQVGNNTVNVMDDIQYMQLLAEKRTGINAMGMGSVPQPSNANRTASGLGMQQAGSSVRLSEIVANQEQYLLLPVLYKMYRLMQFHSRPGEPLAATSGEDQYTVDSMIVHKPIRFRMLAASKMVTRDKLMQIFPFWMQAISQGNLMEQLTRTGKTVDFDELFKMLQDATGVSHLYQLIRPLNQQEQQQLQQPPPNVVADQQKSQQEAQLKTSLMDKKIQGDVQVEQIKKQPNFWDAQVAQQESQRKMQESQQKMAMDAEAKQQELKQKAMMAQIEIQAKREQHQQDLQKRQVENQLDLHKSQQDSQVSAMDHQMKMAQIIQTMQATRAQAANQQDISEEFPAAAPEETGKQGGTNVKRPARQSEGRHKQKGPTA